MRHDRGAAASVHGIVYVIELYRTMISPLRPPSCRFTPTCSQYAVDALREFGVVRGTWLSVVRLAKCGPWHRGGWDPIPERNERGDRPRTASRETVDSVTLRSDSVV